MSKKPPKVQNLDIPWRKVVLDADADWAADRHRELEYDFSAPGRRLWGDPYKRGPYKPRPYNNGRLNRTLARLQAQGTILIDGRSASVSVTFEQLGFSATGHVPVLGVANVTFAGLGVTATGSAPATGTLTVMLDWMRAAEQFGPMWISVGVGRVAMRGAGSATFDLMTSTGTGTVEGAYPGEGAPMGLLLAITSTGVPPVEPELPTTSILLENGDRLITEDGKYIVME
jgi:hypothetical protein